MKGNSSIPIFDTKPINFDVNSSDQNLFQPSSSASRLPSFQHKPGRQKLSLTTRKCLSSNVTPISSPIIPRSINNNYHPPVHEFSKEVIESSAKLINDIDVTLSQLSKQYYSDNNNLSESTAGKSTKEDDTSPTSLRNNNGVSHFSNLTNESCDCRTMNKLKIRKSNCPERCGQESRQSNLPVPNNDTGDCRRDAPDIVSSRPTKLPVNNYYRTPKSVYRRTKSSVVDVQNNEDRANSNPSYTEAWVYNTPPAKEGQSMAVNKVVGYINQAATETRKSTQSALPIYQANMFHKPIFTQHRHNCNDANQSTTYSPKIPLPSHNKPKNNNEDTNRDSGIYLSCPTDGKVNINQMNMPQPPPRISSLVSTSLDAMTRCPTLTNQNAPITNGYLYRSNDKSRLTSKIDRRKARDLFISVKQRDEIIKKTDINSVETMQKKTPEITNKEVLKCSNVNTPNSDLENVTVEGYCSDMDNLKNSGYFSDQSGYLSEGGLGQYAQKMQQRFREGLQAVEESLLMTQPNKIVVNRKGSFEKDDISSTSSEEIEDYLRELSSRLVGPKKAENKKVVAEATNATKIRGSDLAITDLKLEKKAKMYKERLEKYACDVEPTADFDITSSCSMDLLTGKALSDMVSENDSIDYKNLKRIDRGRLTDRKLPTNVYDYTPYPGRKLSGDSDLRAQQLTSGKSRSGLPEILDAAGPSPAIFEEDNPLQMLTTVDGNHYRAMSLPGRPRSSAIAWQRDTTLTYHGDSDCIYTLPPPQLTNSNIYYDVPVTRPRPGRTSGNHTPSLLNVRLPYATQSQGVKNSVSTSSLGKRDSDTEDIYEGLGSRLSLLSAGSYRSLNEERQATEIRKLRRDLELAQSKVKTLSGQLSNNGTLVSAFEGTLHSMSMRLQKFAANSESKESELNELKSTIESLKKHAGSSPIQDQTSPKIYASSSLTSLSSNSNSNDKRSDGSVKKSSWFKASLGRAFRKKSSKDEGSSESINEISSKDNVRTQTNVQSMTECESLQAMRKELEEKDARLTDVQLDALSRSHQLEQLRDLLTKMRYEMSSLKADNTRLQCLMTTSNGAVSTQSLDQSISAESIDTDDQNSTLKSTSKFKDINDRSKFDFLNDLVKDIECSKPLMVFLTLNNINNILTSYTLPLSDDNSTIPIGRIGISSMTSWSDLENSIRRLLKEYVAAIDPLSSLGLNGESIARYRINNDTFIHICSTGGMRPLTSPLSSCDNIPDSKIYLDLKNHSNSNSIDDMVFEFLIPKTILQRYFGLLLDHRRIILSGPSGTGKSYLAHKLAWNLALRYNRDPGSSILIFNLDKKSTKELRNYMATLTEQLLKTDPHSDLCLSPSSTYLPLVIVLDNLQHVSSFSEIFNSFLSIHPSRSPFVIGTMNQMNTTASNNLQLHHNFRWVLCTNHMEPVKGFLGRYLRRQFLRHQIESKQSLDQLYHVIEWISIVWQHINKFLETYSSPDVTIGPRLFLNCPMSIDKSKAWFIDLWNYSLVPYVLDAVRDGLNTHGRKQATWDDPTDWIIRSWPWNDMCASMQTMDTTNLIRLRSEDVGFDSYQLITTTSAHILGPYSVSSHLQIDPINSSSGSSSARQYSSMVDNRRSRQSIMDRSDHSDSLMAMFLRTQTKTGHNK